jgi:murein DD-endopeptidase MepM/ murein hydrolase activator NlpD
VLGAGALVIAALGLAMAARRRPFVQPARMAAFVVLALVVGSASYPLPFPAEREGHSSRVEFDFPLEGEWTVAWGGADSSRNLLARSRADRRFGYDLVLDRDGSRHAGDGSRPQDWYAFGRPLFAPCDGTVVSAVDGIADRPPLERSSAEEELGNHLVLEVAPHEYLFLCNLRIGSLRVAAGQQVSRGDPLAEVGSSGLQRFTSGPHLALHLQDTPEPRWGQGIPMAFHDVLVDGEPVDRAQPRGRSLTDPDGTPGQRVRRAP